MNLILSIIKKVALIIIFITFCCQNSNAQEVKNDFWNHVRFGGGLGLNFGDGFFSATMAPSGIYEFDKNFSLGIGANFTFNSLKNTYKSTILGGSIIGLFDPIQDIQISAEFEQLNVNRRYNVNLNTIDENYWVPALYLGAGYRNGNVTFGVRYDVLYDTKKSIYAEPWAPFVRFYF
ncbi:alpha-ketoglutarate decarboxylase [uncultured Algibacter sp.]|uniref:alpha-ketoglutarate decarboxylase n=1 Tax=uncultured Algibacter sp. TaxID=298659 RepID=UPI002637135A|nr:alpha-ketoglutarate decarboxylase [uncultured Algibacter sp.]